MGTITRTITVTGEGEGEAASPVHLHCTDSGGDGDGPPLLLLHGLAGHSGEWDALAARFAPTHRVAAFDARGSGASTRRPADVSRAAHVRDVVQVARALRLPAGQLVLVGQSMGGITALLTAAAHPELVRALVLIEAGPDGPSPGRPQPRAAGDHRRLAGLVAGPVPRRGGGGRVLRRGSGGPRLGGRSRPGPRGPAPARGPGRHGRLGPGERPP